MRTLKLPMHFPGFLFSGVSLTGFAIALSVTCLIGCGKWSAKSETDETSSPRIVLLYVPGSVGKQFLSPYNDQVTYTPNLKAFAREATVFTKHRTEAGLPGTGFASILTGNQAPDHGVFSHPTYMSDTNDDITEAFAENGYDVYFWNDHPMCTRETNFCQGVPEANVYERAFEPDDLDFAMLLRDLRADKTKRALVVVNHRLSHSPYRYEDLSRFQIDNPKEVKDLDLRNVKEFRRLFAMYRDYRQIMQYDFGRLRKEQNLSDDEVEKLSRVLDLVYKSSMPRLDEQFGEIVKRIDGAGLGDDSIIAFTTDHGETLFQPAATFKWSHAYAVQADTIDVPLIIRAPKWSSTPFECNIVTRSIDVFPTLAALAQVKIPTDTKIAGQDLSAYMKPDHADPNLSAFSHSGMIFPMLSTEYPIKEIVGSNLAKYYPTSDMKHTWVAVRRGDTVWKYRPVEGGQEPIVKAFDLADDPGESTDIYDQENPIHQQMSAELAEYKKKLVDSTVQWESNRSTSVEEDKACFMRLKMMGYVK